MQFSRHRSALVLMVVALAAAVLAAVPAHAASDCPSGQTQFKIDAAPSNGTYGDGTLSVTISNADQDSFSWSSNIAVESVMVKAGTSLKQNSGGTSGNASSATNPNNGKPYGISHVSFCYETSGGSSTGGGGGDSEDCPDGNGKDKGNMPEGCDEEETTSGSDDCPDGKGKGNGNMPEGCEEVESERESRDDKDEDCPDNGKSNNGNMPAGCDDDDDDEALTDECAEGDGNGTGGGNMDEDCEEEDETLGDVTDRPATPEDGPNVAGGGDGPETAVLGIRASADRGRVNVAAATAPEVRAQQGPGAETLPRTGLAVVPYLLAGFGLIAMGAFMRRRRIEGSS